MTVTHLSHITRMLRGALEEVPLPQVRGRVIQVVGTIVKLSVCNNMIAACIKEWGDAHKSTINKFN